MTKQLISILKVLVLALVLSVGISQVFAWSSPSSNPPAGNASAPLNVSATAQTKTGNLTVNGLSAGTLQVTGGTPAVNKVLTSDASGNATWQTPAVGAGDNLGNHTATQALNMAGNNITSVNNITVAGNGAATFGPNSSWGAYLTVGGNGRTTTNASVAATNGNLHIDSQNGGYGTYLNYYSGGPTIIGTGGAESLGRLTVGEAGGLYSLITMRDSDESPNGVKYIHANSNNIGFLSGQGGWITRWDNAGNQVTNGSINAAGGYVGLGGVVLTPHYVTASEDSYGGWSGYYYTFCNGWYNHDTCDGNTDYPYTCSASKQTSPTCVDAMTANPADQGWCGRWFQDRTVTCNAQQYLSAF